MTGVRDPLVSLHVPRCATLPSPILDFLHPCEPKIGLGSVAGSCLNLAGGCMGESNYFFNTDPAAGRIRMQRARPCGSLNSLHASIESTGEGCVYVRQQPAITQDHPTVRPLCLKQGFESLQRSSACGRVARLTVAAPRLGAACCGSSCRRRSPGLRVPCSAA